MHLGNSREVEVVLMSWGVHVVRGENEWEQLGKLSLVDLISKRSDALAVLRLKWEEK